MLPKENRVSSRFFKENKKPDFSFNLPSLTLKVFKGGKKPNISVIISAKNTQNAVKRNEIKRKILNNLNIGGIPPHTYLIYPKKGAKPEEVKKDFLEKASKLA